MAYFILNDSHLRVKLMIKSCYQTSTVFVTLKEPMMIWKVCANFLLHLSLVPVFYSPLDCELVSS